MSAIIDSPPPNVKAPMAAKSAAMRGRLGAGAAIAGGASGATATSGSSASAIISATSAITPARLPWNRKSPTPPASRRIAAAPSGLTSAAAAATAAMSACVHERTADLPSRNSAAKKIARTTGPRPYRAPRTIGLTPNAA